MIISSDTRVLVVDADIARAVALCELLAPAGFEPSHAAGIESATELMTRTGTIADVVLLALDAAGLRGVTQIATVCADAELVLLAGADEVALARAGLRLGASDFVERERGMDSLLFALERAARDTRRRRELAILRARVGDEAQEALVGRSAAMTRVRELVGRAAASRVTTLVTGEQGTGKDVVARLVHDLSDRAGRPCVTVRCSGADAPSLESELFGAARGGLLEAARGGTLVLDEVETVPRALRARLGRLLAERVVRRAGAMDAVPVDVRVILTARASDERSPMLGGDLSGDGNVLPIALPPLRERRSDIPLLVNHFRARIARQIGVELPPLSPESMTSLLGHQWPGNVRELEHWMERMAYAASEHGMTSSAPIGPGSDFAQLDAARLTLDALERKYILHVLALERGHQSRAAERLGIDRRTLYRKLKEYREDGVAIPRVSA